MVGRAAGVLRAGGTVVLPTDTVYGVAALPTVAGATARLFALKARSAEQPLAVLVADADQALPLAEPPATAVDALIGRCWPGPLTLVLRRSAGARALELGGDPATIGLRCPDHDLVREVAARVGPLATTSANRHGQPTPDSAAGAAAALDGPVDLVVDGGRCAGLASTVIDATVEPWKVLRQGALTTAELEP